MLRPIEAQWWREYEYLQAFPGTSHDQYMHTPREAIDWLTRIHAEVQTYKREQREKAMQEAKRG